MQTARTQHQQLSRLLSRCTCASAAACHREQTSRDRFRDRT